MSNKLEITFSKNLHDKDGDVYQECLLIHFGDDFIMTLKDEKQLDIVIAKLQKISKELKQNW